MITEKRREQYSKQWEKKKAKMQESGTVRKIVTLKAGETIKIVKESDPNQVDLCEKMQKETLEEIRKIIDGIREKNKGTIILAKQKDLTTALQQIEELL